MAYGKAVLYHLSVLLYGHKCHLVALGNILCCGDTLKEGARLYRMQSHRHVVLGIYMDEIRHFVSSLPRLFRDGFIIVSCASAFMAEAQVFSIFCPLSYRQEA